MIKSPRYKKDYRLTPPLYYLTNHLAILYTQCMITSQQRQLNWAYTRAGVALGIIEQKAECEDCGDDRRGTIAHHELYGKENRLLWLCRSCHYKRHLKERGNWFIKK